MRQTQNVTPSNMNVTLTGSCFFIFLVLLKGVFWGTPAVLRRKGSAFFAVDKENGEKIGVGWARTSCSPRGA